VRAGASYPNFGLAIETKSFRWMAAARTVRGMTNRLDIQDRRLGIDIGRVIIGGSGRGDTAIFDGSDEDSLRTPEVPGAIATIAALTRLFAGKVWLVSKCGPKVQGRTRKWLRHHDFWRLTGVPEQNLRFCLERRDKAIHCKQNRLTHFIDDRLDVLAHLRGLVTHRFLFGPQRQDTIVPADIVRVADWKAVARAFELAQATAVAL
jgi:hypothetical protein